jgi:ABC-type dipeptide/oligopeptide/nickel transport system ATPase component
MMTIDRQMNLVHQKLASNDLDQKTLSVRDALELAKLQDASRVLRQYPHELSGGMKQRIVIGIALMGRPDLIVADEPTSALDVTVQLEIMSLFRETVHQLGTSMLLISHHLGVVAGLADQVLVMRSGSIIERGSVDSVYLNPEESYTKQLMGVGAANGSP